jgi:ABC-2 type transport system permease protein|uniref:ABC transporter permease n=1 Tax=Desulfobacca acetoxidans TaxID=60893 RepID=A0A7V6A1W3_9BACT
MIRRLRHLIWKEFIQVLRDKKLRLFIFLPPIIQLIAYGYAINFDIKNVPTAIFDESHSAESRHLISRFAASEYFAIKEFIHTEAEQRHLIDDNQVTMVLRIPYDFARLIKSDKTAAVQVIVDATDSNAALIVGRYADTVIADFSLAILKERLARLGSMQVTPPVALEPRAWYNANLSSRYSFVPGVIAMVIMLVSLMLTALAVVREKEIGTIEQILVSPIRPVEFMLGKTIPFIVISMLDMVVIILVGVFWFEVPLRGSLLVLFLGAITFLFNSVGLGLFISTVSSTQQQAMMAGTFFFTPAILLSGLIFPIPNMPPFFQYLTYLNPLRYFVVVVQGIFLRGDGLAILWPQMAGMTVLGLTLLTLSVLRFQKRLA